MFPHHGRTGVAGVLLVLGVLTACSPGSAPEVPTGPDGEPDPVLVAGRSIYEGECARCHGAGGGGGTGPQLNDGRATGRYPDIEEQIALVTNGRGSSMPAFASRLSEADIEAVVRYSREVL